MTQPTLSRLDDAITELLQDYFEVNAEKVDVLGDQPSPIQFLKYVASNRPFIISKGCSSWPAVQKWNVDYLLQAMSDAEIDVAETPRGNADSALALRDGQTVFVKPYQRRMQFSHFMSCLLRSSSSNDKLDTLPETKRVYYSQAQNDNLRNEYSAVAKDGILLRQLQYIRGSGDVKRSISWADEALGENMSLDAVNLWLGNDKSITALHTDNYENIYCQIIGIKHFLLLPPIAAACINEQWIKGATYLEDLSVAIDEDGDSIPFALWDPDQPESKGTAFSHLCKPLRVTLEPGDILYLPSSWYHKVSQANASSGINCAVNYWYDQNYSGSAACTNNFIRKLAWAVEPRI